MIRIVTWTYRYKLPQNRKGRKLAEITGPIVVTPKESRRPARVGEAAAAGMEYDTSARLRDRATSTPARRQKKLQVRALTVGDRHVVCRGIDMVVGETRK